MMMNSRLTLGLLGLGLLLLSGCATATLTVQNPAEIDTTAIRTVAVGNFEVAMLQSQVLTERNGNWNRLPQSFTPAQQEAISRAVRARVINLLTETPYFQVVFTDEFAALENDTALQKLISTEGYTTQGVDAVLNGKVWVEMERLDGVDLSKEALTYFRPPNRQGRGGQNLTVEEVIWWPYKAVRGSMALELKLTRLAPTRVVATTLDSRTYAHRIGGSPSGALENLTGTVSSLMADQASGEAGLPAEILPSFDQLIADLSSSIAAQFVKRVAVTERTLNLTLDPSGDETARVLMQAQAWNAAIDRLQQVTATAPEPADLYHLGLCFEATGDYGLARGTYLQAWQATPENLTYAQALGRLERLQREYPQLRKQLQSRETP